MATRPLAVSIPEAARLLSVSTTTIRRMIADGQLRGVPIGKPDAAQRALRIPYSDLEDLLAGSQPMGEDLLRLAE